MALNLISHHLILPDLLPRHGDRPRMSKTSGPCGFLSSKDAQSPSMQSIRNRRILQCAAATGGSKRDMEKLIARTQHRRPRHRKGVTPSKSELLEELEEEEETEVDVERLAQLASEDSTSSPYEIISKDRSESRWVKGEEMGVPLPEKKTPQDDNGEVLKDSNGVSDSSAGNATNGLSDLSAKSAIDEKVAAKDTVADTVGKAAETQEDAFDKQSTSSLSEAEACVDEVGASANAIADVAMDTASDTGNKISETGRQVRQDMVEVASDLGVALDKQTTNFITELKGQAGEFGASMNAIADVAMDTTMDMGDKMKEIGQQIGQDLAEVASTGQSLPEDDSKAVSGQAEEYRSQAEEYLEEGGLLERRAERIRSEASKSLDRVQDSVQKAVQSARAAESIGREALGMGEFLVDTDRETIQSSSATAENKRSGCQVESY